jgi:hypothetical protein
MLRNLVSSGNDSVEIFQCPLPNVLPLTNDPWADEMVPLVVEVPGGPVITHLTISRGFQEE